MRGRRRAVAAVALALLVASGAGEGAAAAPASASAAVQAGPAVVPETASGRPGDVVLVALTGWTPVASVTVVLCGNGAERGSEDCEQVGGQSVEVRNADVEYVELPITRPPMPCPCVIRANDLNSDVVAFSPFEVIGAATAPIVEREPSAAPPISVSASLQRPRGSFVDRVRRLLGGPVQQRLELVIRNTGPRALSGITVTGTVGRHAGRGEALEPPAPIDLAPGERREVVVLVDLEPPVHGTHVVSGAVFVAGRSAPFSVSTSSTPWGLVLVALLVLIAVATLIGLTVLRRQLAAEDDRDGLADGQDEEQMTAGNAW